MAGQDGKVADVDAPKSPAPMAGQEGKVLAAADVHAPKSPAPAPAGSDTGGDHLNLALAADQDPDATVPQAKKPRAGDVPLPHAFQVAATVEDAAASGLAPTPFPPHALPSPFPQQLFAAAAGVRPPPRRPPGGTTAPPAGAAIYFGPMTEEQDRMSMLMNDKGFVLRAAVSGNWRPKEAPVLPPNNPNRLKKCVKCNTNPATAAILPSEHICLCHACYEECLANPLKTPCAVCFAAAAAQIKWD